MTPNRRRMDPSMSEDILILKFNTDLLSAQLLQMILQEEKERNSIRTPGPESTITIATGGSSSSSNSSVNIFEDMDDEDNVDDNEGSNFDDKVLL